MLDEFVDETANVIESTIIGHQFVSFTIRICVKSDNGRIITQFELVTILNVLITIDANENCIGTSFSVFLGEGHEFMAMRAI